MKQIIEFLQNKPVAAIAWAIGLVACLLASLILMPAAELMPAQVNLPAATAPLLPGLSPVRNEGAMDFFKGVAEGFSDMRFQTGDLKKLTAEPLDGTTPGEVRAYVLYSIGLALALTAAAIAINAIGRYDSEDKTIIPVKK
jgi:hypothetical protein